MILTEKEAKTKWCGQASVIGTLALLNSSIVGFQALYTNSSQEAIDQWAKTMKIAVNNTKESIYCVTSDCMMWRWTTVEQRTGYCGLGGKPC